MLWLLIGIIQVSGKTDDSASILLIPAACIFGAIILIASGEFLRAGIDTADNTGEILYIMKLERSTQAKSEDIE